MKQAVSIIGVETLSDDWGRLSAYTFEIAARGGSPRRHRWEVYDHGDAAAVLLHDPARDTVVLTRQFRLPAHLGGAGGHLVEACAGLLDGDDPETCARREAEEETGYRVTSIRHLFDAYVSPGSLTEKVHLFIAGYDPGARVSAGGGLAHEGEDIEVIEMAFETALAMIGTGEIADAKTIILLQHLALQEAGRQASPSGRTGRRRRRAS